MPADKPHRVANPIIVRRYGVAGDPGRAVVLTIGKPRPYRDPSGDWMCSVLIEGLPKAKRRRIHGIDGLQALQLAIEYARRTLDASGFVFTWLEGGEPGDVGIPLSVPACWGFAFQRRLERGMDRAVKRMTDVVIPVLKERARRRAAGSGRTG